MSDYSWYDDGSDSQAAEDTTVYDTGSNAAPDWYTTGLTPEGYTFDSFGNMVPVGDASAASADAGGEAQAYLNAIQSGGDVNIGAALNSFKNLLSGKSSLGALGQMAGVAGISALFNKLTGGGLGQSGQGIFKGYTGGIPKYTATRQQYAVPTDGRPAGAVTDQQIKDYLQRPGLTDPIVATNMNRFGISPERMAGITGLPAGDINARLQAAMGPNLTARRPGSGGVTYFSPMQYNKVVPAAAAPAPAPAAVVEAPAPAAAGGLMGYAMGGGLGSLGSYSDGGRLLKGPGDGVSDSIPATIADKQPARLADGEFVVPARIVSEIGNGSTEAGAKKLYAMMDRVQNARKKSLKNVAANTKADKYLPR
jgi:hypothetical protein